MWKPEFHLVFVEEILGHCALNSLAIFQLKWEPDTKQYNIIINILLPIHTFKLLVITHTSVLLSYVENNL